MPLAKVKTICGCSSAMGCFAIVLVSSNGFTIDEISKNEGEVLCELRFLRTQYSKQLFESPIREENSRIEIPLFSHSSTLANIASLF